MFQKLSIDDLRDIAQSHRSRKFVEANQVLFKAREICATQHREVFHQRLSEAHNDMVRAFRKAGLYDALLLTTLANVAEEYAIAELAKGDLTKHEYELITGPLLKVVAESKIVDVAPRHAVPAERPGIDPGVVERLVEVIVGATEEKVTEVVIPGTYRVVTEQGEFFLLDSTGVRFGPFDSATKAVVHAAANRWKLAS